MEPFQVNLSMSQFCRWVKAGSGEHIIPMLDKDRMFLKETQTSRIKNLIYVI